MNGVEWLNFDHLTHDCIYFEFFISVFYRNIISEHGSTLVLVECVAAGLVCVICDFDNPSEECAASEHYQNYFF